MKQIQWFPGHMKKALIEIQKQLKLVDIVFELRDARAPIASENPQIATLIQHKKHIIILTKKDLADPKQTKLWESEFKKQGKEVVAFDVHGDNLQKLVQKSFTVLSEKFAKDKAKGMKQRPIKAMIVGVPNVGKSTLINRISSKKVTVVGNKPGVTKQQQWIRVHKDMELLDTPGVLWPKFEDPALGVRLAALGMIKDSILPLETVVQYTLTFLKQYYPQMLFTRYQLAETLENSAYIVALGQKRGYLIQSDEVDYHQTVMTILTEFREGMIAKVTLDRLGELPMAAKEVQEDVEV